MKDSNTSRSSRRCDLMFYFATIGRLLFLVRAWRWHALDNIGRIVIFDRMPDCIFASFPAILCFSVFPMADTPISCKTRTHLVHFWLDQPVNKSKIHFLFKKNTHCFLTRKKTHTKFYLIEIIVISSIANEMTKFMHIQIKRITYHCCWMFCSK